MPVTDPADPPSKQAIVAAALRLFARDGYAETTIRAVAQEAGYTNPALFKFFASKEELGAYLFVRCRAEVLDRVAPVLADDGPLDDVVRRWAAAWLDLLAGHRDVALFVHEHAATFWPLVQGPGDDDGPFDLLVRWLRRARAAGRVSRRVAEQVQALAVVGTLHQLARHVDVAALRPAARRALEADVARVLAAALRA